MHAPGQITVATLRVESYNLPQRGGPEVGSRAPLLRNGPRSHLAQKGVHHGDSDGSGRDGNDRHERSGNGYADDAWRADSDARGPELVDGAALHAEDGEMHGGHEDRWLLRGQGRMRHGSESLPHAGRRHV